MKRKYKPKLKRPCKYCGEMFVPTGRKNVVCEKCWINSRKNHKRI